MSFKRDGDDKCALDNQRKRRVAELLNEDIEEDEVTRLSNGKYKCKLCFHQPIFDTLNMFYVHKQGKKHQCSTEYAAQQKQELADLIAKRNHEQHARVTQAEEDVRSNKQVYKTGLGVMKPRKPHDRKPVLDLDACSSNRGLATVSIETTPVTHLPGNRLHSNSTSLSLKHITEPFKKGSNSGISNNLRTQEKHLRGNTDKSSKGFKMEYKNQPGIRQGGDNCVVSARDVPNLVGHSGSELSNKFYLSRKKQQVEINSLVRNHSLNLNEDGNKLSTISPQQTWEFYKNCKGKVPFKSKGSEKPVHTVSTSSVDSKDIKGLKEGGNISKTEVSANSKEKTERAEKFLNAFGSGWKRDWTGSWVKDEDAEFDSDEEPPDIS